MKNNALTKIMVSLMALNICFSSIPGSAIPVVHAQEMTGADSSKVLTGGAATAQDSGSSNGLSWGLYSQKGTTGSSSAVTESFSSGSSTSSGTSVSWGSATSGNSYSWNVSKSVTAMTGTEFLINCADGYNAILEMEAKRGEKWVYSNKKKYAPLTGSFQKAVNGKVKGGNSASIANWAFRDMGIIGAKDRFYAKNGKIANYNTGSKKLKSKINKACKVISYKGKKKFNKLLSSNKIQPGDIIIGKNHMFIYRGGDYVFASGLDAKWHKDSIVKTEAPEKAVFDSWLRKYKGNKLDEKCKVYYVIRLKKNFRPSQKALKKYINSYR